MTHWHIVKVTDTRLIDEHGQIIPNSGSPRQCDHCGKTHEVYCDMERGSEHMTVGSTCAKKLAYDYTAVTTSALKSAAIQRWHKEIAAEIADSIDCRLRGLELGKVIKAEIAARNLESMSVCIFDKIVDLIYDNEAILEASQEQTAAWL
jgi:hypothetical protein